MKEEIRNYVYPLIVPIVVGTIFGVVGLYWFDHTDPAVALTRRIVYATGLVGALLGAVYAVRVAIFKAESTFVEKINKSIGLNDAFHKIAVHSDNENITSELIYHLAMVSEKGHPFFKRMAANEISGINSTLAKMGSGRYECEAVEEPFLTLEAISLGFCTNNLVAISPPNDLKWWISEQGLNYAAKQRQIAETVPSVSMDRYFIVENEDMEQAIGEAIKLHNLASFKAHIVPAHLLPAAYKNLDIVVYDECLVRVGNVMMDPGDELGRPAFFSTEPSEVSSYLEKANRIIQIFQNQKRKEN